MESLSALCQMAPLPPLIVVGTLSKDDDDGSENDGKKNEFPVFQT